MFNYDFLKGPTQFQDCSTLVTNKRKNDQERKGHWMRVGKLRDPKLDINHRDQFGRFIDLAGNRPSTAFDASTARGRACRHCLPLFPKLLK